MALKITIPGTDLLPGEVKPLPVPDIRLPIVPSISPEPEVDEMRAGALLDDALTKNPDQAVAERNLATDLNQTPETVQADPVLSKQVRDRRAVEEVLAQSPITKRHLETRPGAMDAASDDVESLGMFENIAVGIGERFYKLVGDSARGLGTTADSYADILEQVVPLGRITYDFTGDIPKIGWEPSTQADIDEESPLLSFARDFEGVDLKYKQGTTWEEFKEDPLFKFLPFAIEQGLVSLPDMVAVMANLPAYVLARSADIGQTRAKNNGKVDATIEDFVKALPAAAGSALLERLGTKGILGIDDALKHGGFGEVVGATLKGGGKELGTEGAQEGIESTGETLGTDKGFDGAETFERVLQGMVGGAGFGVTVRAGTASVESFKLRKVRRVRKVMDKLNKVASESKYQTRDPEGANAHQVEVISEQLSEVGLSVDKVIELAEAHPEGPAEFLSKLGVSGQLAAAMEAQKEAEQDTEETTETPKKRSAPSPRLQKIADKVDKWTPAVVDAFKAAGETTRLSVFTDTANDRSVFEYLEDVSEAIEDVMEGMDPKSHIFKTLDNLQDRGIQLEGRIARLPLDERNQTEQEEDTSEDVLELTEDMALDPKTDVNAPGNVVIPILEFTEQILGTGNYDTVSEDLAYASPNNKATIDPTADSVVAATTADIKLAQADTLAGKVKEVGKSKVEITAATLKRLAVKTTSAAIKGVRSAFRKGIKKGITDKKAVQTAAIDLIESSGLNKADIASFIRTVKNIDTVAQLENRLPGIENRVLNLMAKKWQREVRTALKKLVKHTKAPATGQGKYDAESQRVLDIARDTLNMTKKAAQEELLKNLNTLTPDPDKAFKNSLLGIVAGGATTPAADIEQMVMEIKAIKDGGRQAASFRRFNRRVRINSAAMEAGVAVTEGTNIDAIDNIGFVKRLNTKLRKGGDQIWSMVNAWDENLDIILNTRGTDAGALIRSLEMTTHLQRAKGRIINWQKEIDAIGIEAYGLQTQKQFMEEMYRSEERHDVAPPNGKLWVDGRGKEVRLQYTRSEARKMWMERQDPTIRDSYTDAEKGKAYTEDMISAIDSILTEGDKAFAQGQLEFYQKAYKDINKVYERVYGTSLPFNPFYSPIQRDKGGTPADTPEAPVGSDNILVEELQNRAGINGSLKKRKENTFPLLKRSDTGALNRWKHDMAHFIETAERAAFIHGVFSNSRLRNEIKAIHSEAMMEQMDSMIRDYTTGYPKRGTTAEAWMNGVNRRLATSVLAAKATIGMKQFASYFAMSEDIPVATFLKNSGRAVANWKTVINTLYTPNMQARGSSQDFELAKMGSREDSLFNTSKPSTIEHFLMGFIRYGDRLPIYMGGYARYLHHTEDLGWSKEKALEDFDRHVNATQQSTDIDKLSELARGGAWGRTANMFMTARVALLRGEMRAIRQRPVGLGGRGKIGYREFGKRMAMYHLAIPMLIQFIASGGRFEKDKQLTAMLLGQLNNFVIFGDMLYWAVAVAIEGEADEGEFTLPIADIVAEAWEGASEVADQLTSGDIEMEALMEAMLELTDVIGHATGKPLEQGKNIIIGGLKIVDGVIEEGSKLIMGWSPTVAEDSSAEN